MSGNYLLILNKENYLLILISQCDILIGTNSEVTPYSLLYFMLLISIYSNNKTHFIAHAMITLNDKLSLVKDAEMIIVDFN